MLRPFNFEKWVADNRHLLIPPVGNKQIFQDSTFIVMAVGGPNQRTDFHVNQTDEFFYQWQGNIVLKIINEQGKMEDISIEQGDVFMLKANIPHSPQRPARSVGLVVEKTRSPGELDGLQWYCEKCYTKLYEEFFELTNIETQFGAAFERYYQSEHVRCPQCGHVNGREWAT